MRCWLLTLATCACTKDAAAPTGPSGSATTRDARAPALPVHAAYADLASALLATIPSDARVVGFGELHARTDRPGAGGVGGATTSLAAFTQALPAIGDRFSDLVIETWIVDPACGKPAVRATARVEATMQRPAETKTQVASLADIARAAHIQPHAMTLTCADYAMIAPASAGTPGEVDAEAMLTLTTRELTRIATSAVHHRDREPGHRPWIGVYGGALHNDRFPAAGVAEWSYGPAIDQLTAGHFVEVDVIAPAIAAAEPSVAHEPWFPLVGATRDPARPVVVWQRGERSFVVVVAPSTPAAQSAQSSRAALDQPSVPSARSASSARSEAVPPGGSPSRGASL